MASLELKIPPPVIALLTAAAMWAVARWGPLHGLLADIPPGWRLGAATVVAFVGVCFDVAGILAFRLAKTTANPMKPENSAALVSSGVYRITRNPMYVGLCFILLAWAVYLGATWALLGPLVFVAYITRFQIKPEERVLAARFGAAFASYQSRVRRWL